MSIKAPQRPQMFPSSTDDVGGVETGSDGATGETGSDGATGA